MTEAATSPPNGGRNHSHRFGRLLSDLGISSASVATATGYAESAVRAWRRGARIPQRGARALLAAFLSRRASRKYSEADVARLFGVPAKAKR